MKEKTASTAVSSHEVPSLLPALTHHPCNTFGCTQSRLWFLHVWLADRSSWPCTVAACGAAMYHSIDVYDDDLLLFAILVLRVCFESVDRCLSSACRTQSAADLARLVKTASSGSFEFQGPGSHLNGLVQQFRHSIGGCGGRQWGWKKLTYCFHVLSFSCGSGCGPISAWHLVNRRDALESTPSAGRSLICLRLSCERDDIRRAQFEEDAVCCLSR